MSAGLPSGSGKPHNEIETNDDNRKTNKEFFMGRILITVRNPN
jgi:hypothetical protein